MCSPRQRERRLLGALALPALKDQRSGGRSQDQESEVRRQRSERGPSGSFLSLGPAERFVVFAHILEGAVDDSPKLPFDFLRVSALFSGGWLRSFLEVRELPVLHHADRVEMFTDDRGGELDSGAAESRLGQI